MNNDEMHDEERCSNGGCSDCCDFEGRLICERSDCHAHCADDDARLTNDVIGLPYCSRACLLLDAGECILETPDVWPAPLASAVWSMTRTLVDAKAAT